MDRQDTTSASVIGLGLGLAAVGLVGRQASRLTPAISRFLQQSISNSKFYRGGFDAQMSRREASQVLGVGLGADVRRISQAHKRIMALNHPDRGGSPYLAAKINQAKELLLQKKS